MTTDLSFSPPVTLPRPVMLQGWKNLSYVHWSYPPEVVQRRLPSGLEVDTFDDRAWVGLVAFQMERIRLPRGPAAPYLGTFPETNVRTYVRGPDGQAGVWFDSLDISRLLPVAVARAAYGLPYMWSKMRINTGPRLVTYRAERRWPGPHGASSTLILRRGDPIAPSQVDPLTQFLTARWGLYTLLGSRMAYAPVEHEPWPLEEARLCHVEDQLLAAAGYPAPAGTPLVHYSPGVEVRIGLPRRITG